MNNTGIDCTGPLIQGFFFFFNKYVLQYYMTFSWLIPLLQNKKFGGPTVRLYADFQLFRGQCP